MSIQTALGSGRPAPAAERIVGQVGAERPRLVDHWEATALIESFGYTDSRVHREFGFPDTRTLGVHVFDSLTGRRAPDARPEAGAAEARHPALDLLNSVGSSFVYALPWLITFVVERRYPDLLQLSGAAGPPLSVALMFSLIVSGGFVQALTRRGQFYLGIKQPGLAAVVCTYIFKLGVMTTLVFTAAAVLVGWYFTLFSWPYLVVAADQFIVLTVLWMTLGILTIRREHWRIPAAFAIGALTFLLLRAAGCDTLAAQLLATGAVLCAALAQVPAVLGAAAPAAVPRPRFTVVLYRVLPYFWNGTVYFCFLFADRLTASASVAALSGAPFGMRNDYKLGMDIALMTFLFAAAAVEYANIRFARLLVLQMRKPYDGNPETVRRALVNLHASVVLTAVTGFLLVTGVVSAIALTYLPGQPRSVWMTMAFGDLGYVLFAVGLLNALILFTLNAPWAAVKALTAGLVLNLAVGATMSHVLNTYFAAAGLVSGACLVCLWSTVAVRDRLRRADYAVAAF